MIVATVIATVIGGFLLLLLVGSWAHDPDQGAATSTAVLLTALMILFIVSAYREYADTGETRDCMTVLKNLPKGAEVAK